MTAHPPRRAGRWLLDHPLTARRAGQAIAVATVVVTLLSGIAMWLVDREEFPNVWLGLWWAVQTVTTVGYGDVTPTHVAGRLVGAVVMLEGIAFIAIVTAAITSSFVARATRANEAARLQDTLGDRELMERRFDELERKLDRLLASREAPGP